MTVLGSRRLAAAVAVGLLVCYLVLTLLVAAGGTQAGDDAWYRLMVRSEWAPAVAFATAFDVIGGSWVTVPIRIVVPVVLAVQRRWVAFVLWIGIVVPIQVASLATKVIVDRSRPPLPLVETLTASYPSGHTTNAAAMAFALVLVFTTPGTCRRRVAVMVGIAWMLTMAWSRTYLRAHWLSDVSGALLLGVGGALATAALAHRWWRAREQGARGGT